MTSKTRTFCVKFSCDQPSLWRDILKILDLNNLIDQRKHLEQLVEGLGSGLEHLSGIGRTTTWKVEEQKMVELLEKVQSYNQIKEHDYVIYMEIY